MLQMAMSHHTFVSRAATSDPRGSKLSLLTVGSIFGLFERINQSIFGGVKYEKNERYTNFNS